jgi:hypothetical protein
MDRYIKELMEEIRMHDEDSIEERTERYAFLKSLQNENENIMFHGDIARLAFYASGNSFIQAHFIGTIIMAQIVIDQTLNQMFYASGEFKGNANFPTVIKVAREKGWITDEEQNAFTRLKNIRNPYVHYKEPLNNSTLLKRSIDTGKETYEILEEDAKHAISSMYKIVNKFTF